MRLSEAIRMGSMLKPQAFRASTFSDASCALQAACDAIGKPHNEWFMLNREYAWLRQTGVCPECGLTYGGCTYLDLIWHLNDNHKLSREQIADLAEKWEPATEVEQGEHPSVETGVEVGVNG